MCILPIQVGVILGVVATSLMRKIPKPCSWRLATWREAYATNSKSELFSTLTSLSTGKRMVVIGADQGLLLTSLSRMMKTTIMSFEIEIHLWYTWEIMLWIKHSTKFPDHLSRARLREEDFLNSSLSPRSPCTMVEQTLWSMLAISIKEWLYTPRTWSWCVRYSHPAWGLWRWGGLMVWVPVPLIPLRNSLKHLDPALSCAAGFLGL